MYYLSFSHVENLVGVGYGDNDNSAGSHVSGMRPWFVREWAAAPAHRRRGARLRTALVPYKDCRGAFD